MVGLFPDSYLPKSFNLRNHLPPEAGVVNEPQLIRCRLGELNRSGKGGSLCEELAQAAEHILALLAPAGEQALQGRVVLAPHLLLQPPLIFCLTLRGRKSLSAWLLVKGTPSSRAKRSTVASRCCRRRSRLQPLVALGRPRFEGGFQGWGSAASACSSKRRNSRRIDAARGALREFSCRPNKNSCIPATQVVPRSCRAARSRSRCAPYRAWRLRPSSKYAR